MATKRGQKPGPAAPASNGKAPANAWARPLKTTGPPPGMGAAVTAESTSRAPTPGTKPTVNKKGAIGSVTSNIHRERLLHLSLTLIGQKVVVTLTDGTVLEGVFHTFTPFDGVEADMKNKYVLTAVKVTKAEKGTKIENGSTAILAVEKVCSLYGKSINLDRPNQNGAAKTGKGGEFVTDTQISGAKTVGGKDLVAAGSVWTTGGKQTRADALAGALGGPSAKDTSGLKGSIGKWDQFKANEELFNVNASFDENLYTTELDKTQIDARKIAEAERIAREIETTTSTNIHIAEERGHAVETDYDEEDRYSGVLTKDGKQRHEVVEKPVPAPKMNYAAAAAKADTAKKAASAAADAKPAQVAKEEAEKPEKARVEAEVKKEEKPAETPKEALPAPEVKVEEEVKEDDDSKQEERKEEVKKTSKLNANAKEFTFNPSAKSFTPSFATGQPQLPPMDPNFHMHGGHPMQPPHYMPAQMGQPGMMPMLNPQYAGMRYPPQYLGMEQQGGPQMPPLQQPPTTSGGKSGVSPPPGAGMPPTNLGAPTPPPGGDGDSTGAVPQEGESSQPLAPPQGPQSQQQPPHHQQQPMPVPYNMPQGAYFAAGGMPMHPRGPGGYPPQFVGGPQQMPVPQGGPYGRQMYPMQPGGMPPNMMRGPGGAPYYAGPGAPMPYPPNAYGHAMIDDDGGYRGGRVQGRGRGRGRGRGSGGGGRGRGGQYQPQQQYVGHPGGPLTPQQQGPPDQGGTLSPEQQPDDGNTPM